MTFEFWFIDAKNNIRLLLPVTPGSYEVDNGNEIEIVRATEIGDINIAGHKRLKNMRIEGFFTTNDYHFINRMTYSVSKSMDYVNLFNKWINDKSIVRLVIASDGITRINSQFYIESIKYSEDNSSNGDINYVIDLKEYRAIKAPEVKTQVAMAQNKGRQNTQTKKTSKYTVVSGDSLSKIARKVYGDSNKWHKIYDANKNVIGSNPNLIRPGQSYVIP